MAQDSSKLSYQRKYILCAASSKGNRGRGFRYSQGRRTAGRRSHSGDVYKRQLARQEAFSGTNVEEWTGWKNKEKKRLWELLGMDKMEICSPCPEIAERVMLDGGILREKLLLQVEPDIWLSLIHIYKNYENEKKDCF